jgi:fructosamine-3-kinase
LLVRSISTTWIKEWVLEGKTLKEMASLSEIPENTFYCWSSDNYLGFADKIEGWKRDRKLMLADKNIEKILQLSVEDKDFVRTVSDMSKFVKETLDKENYSKRAELTGKDGNEFLAQPILVKFLECEKSNDDNRSSVGVQKTV